ncbi:hypothetical protein ACWFR1_00480 [Streptomyces sp. NPDC055103]
MNDETLEPVAEPAVTPSADFDRLQHALRDADGDHIASIAADRTVYVASFGGPVPVADGIHTHQKDADVAVQAVLADAGIPAKVSLRDGVSWTLQIDLRTAQGAGMLADLVTRTLPPEAHAARRLNTALAHCEFEAKPSVSVMGGKLGELTLTPDDVRKLQRALGRPEDETVLCDPVLLYPYAERFARMMEEVLGGEVETSAYPFRPDCRNCESCGHDLIVIEWLTFDQADRLSSALEAQAGAGAPS